MTFEPAHRPQVKVENAVTNFDDAAMMAVLLLRAPIKLIEIKKSIELILDTSILMRKLVAVLGENFEVAVLGMNVFCNE